MSWYERNKHEWRKGGKYYTYVPIHERPGYLKVSRGKFLISFD